MWSEAGGFTFYQFSQHPRTLDRISQAQAGVSANPKFPGRTVQPVSHHVESSVEARGKDSLSSPQKDGVNHRQEINPAWQLPHRP